MARTSRWLLAFLIGVGAATLSPATRLLASPAATPADPPVGKASSKTADIPFEAYDFQVEEQLLALANQSRRQAGAPPLTMDAGLSQAARMHAQAMLEARRLSHQFDGEPALAQRLAATTNFQLEKRARTLRSIMTPSMGMNISCCLRPIARTCSIPRTTWLGSA